MSGEPLCIDLYCGLGGWAEGFLAEGYRVRGYDIEAHDYGSGGYPGELVLADVLKLHGRECADAAVIVGSSPCTEYSYMAMPWERAKQIARALRGQGEFPAKYRGSRTIEQLNALFEAQFRIQREASKAAGRYIPLIVENVRGAQPWVGRAKANFGSYYLWGDVGMVGRRVVAGVPRFGVSVQPMRGEKKTDLPPVPLGELYRATGKPNQCHITGSAHIGRKGPGGDWFQDGRQGQDACAEGLKLPGNNNVTAAQRYREGVKIGNHAQFKKTGETDKRLTPWMPEQATKGGGDWFGSGADRSIQRKHGSKSDSRKAASAQIAKIPFPLAQYIARSFAPCEAEVTA